MKNIFSTISSKTLSALQSPRFFYVILGLLLLQSLWIALTAVYPQAFDENYHFGLIKLHSEQLLPFFTYQPDGADVYGAVVRDPSYLFHYLMALPYLLMTLVTSSEAAQVIVLRLINVAIFVGGLYVYRKVLLELGASRAVMHVVLFFFVLTPIMPLLAAQINYDNLMFLVTGIVFLLLVRFVHQIRNSDRINMNLVMQILLWGMIGSLVKFPFAPIFLAVFVALVALIAQLWRRKGGLSGKIDWPRRAVLIGLSLGILVFGGLFVERYGVNVVKYHQPVPQCDDVLSVERCMSYSPWARDHKYSQIYPDPSLHGMAVYPGVWFHRMVWETMFTISSQWRDNGTVEYKARQPLTVPNYTAWTIVTVGLILSAFYFRRLWNMPALRVLLLIVGFYTVVLFLQNFRMYIHSGEAVAIHGRYHIPVYPVLYLMLALAFKWGLERLNLDRLKVWLVIIVAVFYVHGGATLTWIYRSDNSWFWPQTPIAQEANAAIRKILHYTTLP